MCSIAMYWFWSIIYTTPYHVKSQNCMMTMYSLHSTPLPHSPWHHLLTTAVPKTSRWCGSCGWCWLLSDQYRIGCQCHNEKKYHPISANIAHYPITQCQYRSYPTIQWKCCMCTCFCTEHHISSCCLTTWFIGPTFPSRPIQRDSKFVHLRRLVSRTANQFFWNPGVLI